MPASREHLSPTKGETPQPKGNKWLYFTFGATIQFAVCNAAISKITEEAGPRCLFYFASGSLLTSIVYYAHQMMMNKTWWINQNIIDSESGELNRNKLKWFSIMCFVYLVQQTCAFYTLQFATLAGINPGVISTIWSVCPLFVALADRCIFNTKL